MFSRQNKYVFTKKLNMYLYQLPRTVVASSGLDGVVCQIITTCKAVAKSCLKALRHPCSQ